MMKNDNRNKEKLHIGMRGGKESGDMRWETEFKTKKNRCY